MSLFGSTQDLTTKDENDIYPDLLASVDMFTNNVWFMKHFPIVTKLALNLPPSLAEKIAPGYANFRSVKTRSLKDQGIKPS